PNASKRKAECDDRLVKSPLAFGSLAPEPIVKIATSVLASITKSSFRSLARMPSGSKRFLGNLMFEKLSIQE
ncbi:MAG: hypothetical protein WAM72_28710, partial [Xanthobacteraceae bacterium]